jgi:hypothetical protein
MTANFYATSRIDLHMPLRGVMKIVLRDPGKRLQDCVNQGQTIIRFEASLSSRDSL